jgi:transposase
MKNALKKEQARALFVKSTMSRKEIAGSISVTETTLRNWINDGEWQIEKDSQTITRSHLLAESYAQLQAINEAIKTENNGIPTKVLSDAKATIRKEIEALSNQPIYRYCEVFEEFLVYVAKNSPKNLEAFSQLSLNLITQLQKENKG